MPDTRSLQLLGTVMQTVGASLIAIPVLVKPNFFNTSEGFDFGRLQPFIRPGTVIYLLGCIPLLVAFFR